MLQNEAEFLDKVKGERTAFYHLIGTHFSDSGLMSDGILEGYLAFYNLTMPRPTPLATQTLCAFIDALLHDETRESGYRTGYVIGWCAALSEAKAEWFFLEEKRKDDPMFTFHPLQQSKFFDIVDNGGDHPIFGLMMEKLSNNDVFFDGMQEGYTDYYDITLPRPEFSTDGFYQFLQRLFVQDIPDGPQPQGCVDSWRMGYLAGWLIAFGENKSELFYVGRPRQRSAQWTRLRDENDGVDIIGRFEYRERHAIMYALDDGKSISTAEVTAEGILSTCTCAPDPECKHVRLVRKISSWFTDSEIVKQRAVAGD